jgi:hypothetical protein
MDNAKFRYYLFASDGVRKIPVKKVGQPLPQYAGTEQKTLIVLYWQEASSIKTVLRPGLVAFDAKGRCDPGYFVEGAMAMINTNSQAEAVYWQPTQTDLDRVMFDLVGSGDLHYRRIPYVMPWQSH